MKTYFILMLVVLLSACGEQGSKQETTPGATDNTVSKTAGNVTWQVPQAWVEETPSSSMRKAQYRIPKVASDSEDASLVVFYFGGEGGGAEANIDRWCSQIAQPDGRASRDVAEISTANVNGLKQTRVDVSGTYLFRARPMAGPATEKPGYRLLAAVVETSSGPWFFKLVGPQATVSEAEAAFKAFLASVKESDLSAKSE